MGRLMAKIIDVEEVQRELNRAARRDARAPRRARRPLRACQ